MNPCITDSLLFTYLKIVVVESISHVWLFVTPWTVAQQASLSFTISQSLLKFVSIESVVLSNHLILCCPFLLLPSLSQHQVFSNESVLCIRWPEYWSFSFSISPFNEYAGLNPCIRLIVQFSWTWRWLFKIKAFPRFLDKALFQLYTSCTGELNLSVLPRILKLESQMSLSLSLSLSLYIYIYKTQNRVFTTLPRNFSPNETVFCSESKMWKY